MAQATVSIRMDAELKNQMEKLGAAPPGPQPPPNGGGFLSKRGRFYVR